MENNEYKVPKWLEELKTSAKNSANEINQFS